MTIRALIRIRSNSFVGFNSCQNRSIVSSFSSRDTTSTTTELSSNKRKPVTGRKYHTTTVTSHQKKQNDRLIVVGSGVAGCSAALVAAAQYKIPVSLVCAGSELVDCNSYWAQGGIIYRNYDPKANDSTASLVKDIHRAGAGLCKDEAVWKLANDGPGRVRELLLDDREDPIYANVPFDRDENGDLLCCLEASHSAARIIHYADHSGKAITEHITAAAAAHPLIKVINNTIITDLLTCESKSSSEVPDSSSSSEKICVGVKMLNSETGEKFEQLSTRGVVLASGGLGGLYEHSTNPSGFNALGSSVGLALRAGAKCEDLEYVQFHPTSLYVPGEARFLLTEALRGEGALLRDGNGRAFAKDFHPDGELAPRDIVARGVFEWSQGTNPKGGHNVFLDISHRDAKWLKGRFPTIQKHLLQRGMDLTRDMLPIIPAAHYTCGGVTTDINGRTSIPGLYSAGEAARTGLHGGNRLASTSLLEGLVYGAAVGDFIGSTEAGKYVNSILKDTIEQKYPEGVVNQTDTGVASYDLAQRNSKAAAWLLSKLRQTMWNKVGVVRTSSKTMDAINILGEIREEACELFNEAATMETAALRDASFSGEAVAMAASANKVSAGAHYMKDASADEDDLEDSDSEIHGMREAFS